MFTHSMTTLNKTEYMWIHILILDTLKITCTKNLCHIFMLTYFTSLLFQSFDAVIIFSRFWSGHVTHCTYFIIVSIFAGIFTKTSVSKVFRALQIKTFFTVTIVSAGIKRVKANEDYFRITIIIIIMCIVTLFS